MISLQFHDFLDCLVHFMNMNCILCTCIDGIFNDAQTDEEDATNDVDNGKRKMNLDRSRDIWLGFPQSKKCSNSHSSWNPENETHVGNECINVPSEKNSNSNDALKGESLMCFLVIIATNTLKLSPRSGTFWVCLTYLEN